jgi:prepilin peptidase CpaA
MAPYFALADLRLILALFAATMLAAFAAHRGLRAVPAFRSAAPDWASWTHAKFPMGLALSGTLLLYLGLALIG